MTQISTLNHRLSNKFKHSAAPTLVPGFYRATRRYHSKLAGRWISGQFELAENVVEHRVAFRDKTVFAYHNTAIDAVLWTFLDHATGRWLTMRPAEVEATQRYLKAQAAKAAQDTAQENLGSYTKSQLIERARQRGLKATPSHKKDELIKMLKAA